MKYWKKLLPWIGPVAFCVALFILYREFQSLHPREILAAVRAVSVDKVLVAIGFTALSYLMLGLSDLLAVRYAGLDLSARKVIPAAFTAFAFSNSAGNPILTATPLRFRLYSSMGADADGLARIVTFGYLTTWIGIFIAGGAAFVWYAPPLPASIPLPFETARIPGALFLGAGIAWIAIAAMRTAPIRIRSLAFPSPGLRLSLAQVAVSAVDWIASALALWVLLPEDLRIAFVPFLGVFFLGQVFGIASQVPGGFGVFETVVGLSLATTGNAPAVFGSLLLFRLVYYVFPLLCATSFLGLHEFSRRKEVIGRVGRQLGDWVSDAVPHVLGLL
ncbi:MAG: UPF0104 family protein, partial [Gemmatimonadetes bacterium]|nr:UPF0104 family protein [Gemmatimonadota bacterium]